MSLRCNLRSNYRAALSLALINLDICLQFRESILFHFLFT